MLNQQVSETELPRARDREPTQVPGARPAGLPETGRPDAGRRDSSAPAVSCRPRTRSPVSRSGSGPSLGWCALIDTDKYLRRDSLWEVHSRLHQARHHIWALWAAAHGALHPWHGL